MDDIHTEKLKESTLPIVSYSRITTYKTCPKSYKFAYIDKLPRLDKPYTVFGQFCHGVLERFHKEHIKGTELPIEDVMKNCFIDEKKKWMQKLTNEQVREAFSIMQDYLDYVSASKMANVINVEKEICVQIDDILTLYGFIDRVQLDDDGIIHIVDYKTTKDERFLKDRTQLLLYAYVLYLENKDIQKIRTSYIMLKHKMKLLITEHTVAELIEAKDKLIKTWDTIVSDKLHRADPIAWKCKNCDFIKHCKEGQNLMGAKKQTFGEIVW